MISRWSLKLPETSASKRDGVSGARFTLPQERGPKLEITWNSGFHHTGRQAVGNRGPIWETKEETPPLPCALALGGLLGHRKRKGARMALGGLPEWSKGELRGSSQGTVPERSCTVGSPGAAGVPLSTQPSTDWCTCVRKLSEAGERATWQGEKG